MMKLSRLFPLLALLLAASLYAEDTHKEMRIASPWPAQNTIIAIPGHDDGTVGTSTIAKRIPLLRQSLLRIKKAAAVSVNSGHEIDPEQIITLGVGMLFVSQNMVVPQQVLSKQARVQVLVFEVDSLRALMQHIQQTAAMLRPNAQQKAFVYRHYLDRNVTPVTERLRDLPTSQHTSLYHGMDNPLTTTGRPSLNQGWIDLVGDKNIVENWFSRHQQNHSGEVALEKVVTADPVVIIAMNKHGADAILSFPQWASVDTVTHHHVCVSPKGVFWWYRETSEETLQFLWLAKTLYPARSADVNIRRETREFYRQFFGLALNDAQMSGVPNPPR